jgi:adenylate cyclase
MNTQDFKRKLTAIMSADVAGYSRLMGEDEAATVKTIESYKQVMYALIKQHRGRVVDSPGDNLLAEFGSVVDAVQFGVAVQNELKARNADLLENRKMEFRIGINLGDVIEEGERIYGDGLNIAARLESCADPGGICVSKTAFDQIETKLPLGYEYLGEKEVKNIAKPVGAYRVLMEPRVTIAGTKHEKHAIPFWRRKRILVGALAVLVVIIGVSLWNFNFRFPTIEPASKEKMAFPLPDKPSIAVLPFDNLSGDPDQEYFSDGLTEEIITGLSMVPDLFVIARNSSFIYKGKPVKVQQVSEGLGVRYILEGSVRKERDRVRITVQVIDAISGYHKWSKRYDRKLENIFDLQEDIMKDLLNEMRIQLIEGERARLWHREFSDKKIKLEAYEKQMQSRYHFFRMDPEGFAMSEKLAEEVIEIEPNYYGPYVMLAFTSLIKGHLPLAEKYAQKALELNGSAPMALITMGQAYLYKRQWEKANALGERALALDPNGAEAKNHLGYFLQMDGRFEEAISLYEKALRLNPYPPSFYYQRLASGYCDVGRYDEAVDLCKKGLNRNPRDVYLRVVLAATYIWQDHEEEAHAEAKEILKVIRNFSIRKFLVNYPQKNIPVLNNWAEALRKVGLPE